LFLMYEICILEAVSPQLTAVPAWLWELKYQLGQTSNGQTRELPFTPLWIDVCDKTQISIYRPATGSASGWRSASDDGGTAERSTAGRPGRLHRDRRESGQREWIFIR